MSFKPVLKADWEILSMRTMSDKMSDVSMGSSSALSRHSHHVMKNKKKHNVNYMKERFKDKFKGRPEKQKILNERLDKIVECMNDEN
mmetsp:Transcript_28265/g.42792  ORF Transcript_28265/g.42792 Transcript_28265/m.42792 type:complete len:87 (+) Transcript_28265:1129-1389(+)